MAWRKVPADQIRVGDLMRSGSEELWRVTSVMEPNDDWPRGLELCRWQDVAEDEVVEIERATTAAVSLPAVGLVGVEEPY